MNPCDYAPCPWCGDLTDEGADHHACSIAHCWSCVDTCRACLDDITTEGDL